MGKRDAFLGGCMNVCCMCTACAHALSLSRALSQGNKVGKVADELVKPDEINVRVDIDAATQLGEADVAEMRDNVAFCAPIVDLVCVCVCVCAHMLIGL